MAHIVHLMKLFFKVNEKFNIFYWDDEFKEERGLEILINNRNGIDLI